MTSALYMCGLFNTVGTCAHAWAGGHRLCKTLDSSSVIRWIFNVVLCIVLNNATQWRGLLNSYLPGSIK